MEVSSGIGAKSVKQLATRFIFRVEFASSRLKTSLRVIDGPASWSNGQDILFAGVSAVEGVDAEVDSFGAQDCEVRFDPRAQIARSQNLSPTR